MAGYDVIVIGSGLGGISTSIALTKKGYKVLLLERKLKPSRNAGEILPGMARIFFERVGIAEKSLDKDHCIISSSESFWGLEDISTYNLIFNPYGHSWSIDRHLLEAQLVEFAISLGVDCSLGVEIQSINKNEATAKWVVEATAINSGVTYCKWLVDATGKSRFLLKRIGVGIKRNDELFALSICADCVSGNATATESAEDGWWFTTPAPSGKRVISFYCDVSNAIVSQPKKITEFINRCNGTSLIQKYLQHISFKDVNIYGKYADTSYSDEVIGNGWLAVGDAAMSFDPLSSQGICVAMEMGLEAADCIDLSFQGDDQAAINYAMHYQKKFREFIRQQKYYYSLEQRWTRNSFWRNRQGY